MAHFVLVTSMLTVALGTLSQVDHTIDPKTQNSSAVVENVKDQKAQTQQMHLEPQNSSGNKLPYNMQHLIQADTRKRPVDSDQVTVNGSPGKRKEQDEVNHLRQSCQQGVDKIDALVEALRRAAGDSAFIQKAVSVPVGNVQAAFSQRRKYVADTIKTLQALPDKNESTTSKLDTAEQEAGKLHADQLEALHQASRDARDPAAQFVRATQNEVTDEARKVKFFADNMARISPAEQDLANKLHAQVQAATDAAKEHGDLLMRQTDAALDKTLPKAMDDVWQQDLNLKQNINDFRHQLDKMKINANANGQSAPQDKEILPKPSLGTSSASPKVDGSSLSSVDHQKYMKANSKYAPATQIHSAQEAMSKEQLDQWKNSELNGLKFVPAAYRELPVQNIEKMYNQRLHELGNPTQADITKPFEKLLSGAGGSLTTQVQASLTDSTMSMSNEVATMKKRVEKVEALVEALRRAAGDSAFIQKAAKVPLGKVDAAFSERRKQVTNSVKSVQALLHAAPKIYAIEPPKSMQLRVATAEKEVGKLSTDLVEALRHAYRDAREPASQFVRATQNEVMEEARNVKFSADRIVRISPAEQKVAYKFQGQMDAAVDATKRLGEMLTKRTEDALDQGLSKATDDVWQQDLNLKASLHDVRLQLKKTIKDENANGQPAKQTHKTNGQPALQNKQEVDDVTDLDRATAGIALVALALAFFLLYVKSRGVKRSYRWIELNSVENTMFNPVYKDALNELEGYSHEGEGFMDLTSFERNTTCPV